MKKLAISVIALTILLYISIGLNLPIIREIIVFTYLTFVPGYLLVRIIKLEKTTLLETALLAIGLSITFLMFFGLLINQLFLIGISKPLITEPILLSLSAIVLLFLFIEYRRNQNDSITSTGKINFNLTKQIYLKVSILMLPPLTGTVGALFHNIPMMAASLILIALICLASVLAPKFISPTLHPFLIFSISISLLLPIVFVSSNIVGYDSNLEYYVFQLTQNSGHWTFLSITSNSLPTVNYNSMLSITILPTIYASLMNIDSPTLFKILYPFIFSIIPVVLYEVWQKQIGRGSSLVSVFFLIFNIITFSGIGPISLGRQIVSELFLILSIFILLNSRISINKRKILFTIFGISVIFSHYSSAYIYLAITLFLFVTLRIMRKPNKVLSAKIIFLLSAITLSWYSITLSPIVTLAQSFSTIFSKLSLDFLNPSARASGNYLSQPLTNVSNLTSVAIFAIVNAIMILGILALIVKSNKLTITLEYRLLAILSAIILFLCIAIPNVAPALNINRFYAIAVLFLAPCFALGIDALLNFSKTFASKILKKRFLIRGSVSTLLICVLLLSFLLTQTGFVNRLTNNTPLVRPIEIDRLQASTDRVVAINYYSGYISDYDVSGAKWLREYYNGSSVFGDYLSINNVLVSYGLIPPSHMNTIENPPYLKQGSVVFLSQMNLQNDVTITYSNQFNTSQIMPSLSKSDIIYSNGETEIRYVNKIS